MTSQITWVEVQGQGVGLGGGQLLYIKVMGSPSELII